MLVGLLAYPDYEQPSRLASSGTVALNIRNLLPSTFTDGIGTYSCGAASEFNGIPFGSMTLWHVQRHTNITYEKEQ